MNRGGSTSIDPNATIGRISANGPPTPRQSTECSDTTKNTSTTDRSPLAVRWVTEASYSEIYSISRQTLANWRYRDRRSGRTEAPSGFPKYRRFGKAIRYLLEGE